MFFISDGKLRALLKDTLRTVISLEITSERIRLIQPRVSGEEPLQQQLAELETKNQALLAERDDLLYQVQGLQQILHTGAQEVLRLGLVDAARAAAAMARKEQIALRRK